MPRRIVTLVSLVIVIAASFGGGLLVEDFFFPDPDVGYTGATEVTDEVFLEVLNELMENHYSQPSREQLMQGALDGMIDALDDPHTTYFDLEEYESYRGGFGENYVGIGVTVSYADNLIIVEEVKNGGPADGAGIRPNDIIGYVDGEDITEKPFFETIGLITGEVDTEVTIGIIRQGVDTVIHLTMTRAVIENSSVNFNTFYEGGTIIGYIEVTQFGDETYTKFRDAVESLERDNIEALIVDLRNNGGGHLSTVFNMMNQFLIDNDSPMFTTEYYSDGEFFRQEYFASNTSKKPYNIITIVNENSASASEVFSSGMQEQGGYPVLGTVTYGKGTMQTDRAVKATLGDSIHISIGKWLTSEGNWVHFNGGTDGVTPNIIVEQTDTEKAYKLFLIDEEVIMFDTVDPRVANAQLILNTMGYTLRTDGYFDLATKTAIEDIQLDNSLTVTGNIDSDTLEFINLALDLFQDEPDNDTQLQAAINYLINELND